MYRSKEQQSTSRTLLTKIVFSMPCFTLNCNRLLIRNEYTITRNISVSWTCRELGRRSKLHIKKFETQNKEFSVNVHALDSSKERSRDNKVIMFPLYNTKERNRKYHANLLLVASGDKRHYVVIKNLSRLLRSRTAHSSGSDDFICRYCLYSFKHEATMKAHEVSCSEHAAVTAEYPAEPMNILKFKNFGHTLETRNFCRL